MTIQGNMMPPEAYNFQITESKDTEMASMPDKEFKNKLFKKVNDLKKGLRKYQNEIRKLIQDLDSKSCQHG
jgi:uncharacterized coiled-coil DUF342 family protein